MIQHKILVNPDQLTEKPSSPEAAKNYIKGINFPYEFPLEAFKEIFVLPDGIGFSPCEYNDNYRNNDNWLSSSLIVLDFDSGIEPSAVSEMLLSFNITPNVIYSSFSDSPEKRKFRVIIAFDEVYTDKNEYKDAIELFHLLFPMADKKCNSICHSYFPGKELLSYNDSLHQKSSLDELKNHFSGNNVPSILLDNDILSTTLSPDSLTLYNNNIEGHRNSEKKEKSKFSDSSGETKSSIKNKLTGILTSKLSEELNIFNDFHTKHLKYVELFGLATNLFYVAKFKDKMLSGLRYMEEVMIQNNDLGISHYEENDFAIIPEVRKRAYKPQHFKEFTKTKKGINTIFDIFIKQGEIKTLSGNKKDSKISLTQAEEKLQTELKRLLQKPKGSISIVVAMGGLGKTEAITSLEKVTIAFPINKLKEEVKTRMTVPYRITPSIIGLSESNQRKLDQYYGNGLIKQAKALIYKISTEGDEDAEIVNKYFADLQEFQKSSTSTTLTSHAKIFQDPDSQ